MSLRCLLSISMIDKFIKNLRDFISFFRNQDVSYINLAKKIVESSLSQIRNVMEKDHMRLYKIK